METARVIIALAAQNGWRLHHLDVKSIFLNGELEEKVFVKQPKGFIHRVTETSEEYISNFKQTMMKQFEMSDLGLLTSYLGIKVEQTGDVIRLKKKNYVLWLFEQSGMQECNSVSMPLEARFKFSEGSKSQPIDSTKFSSIIESLRYLIHTRPDITYYVGYLSRYMEAPTTEHLAALNRIL
ncbi:unnamed protein product [Spirodela intermedia]|uniref:Reverse transcriptase Ty1/copia-type domain-containing protein n=1 Tax=Spirodela intermedia TaxID=51605 RepID=A0A7I8LD11_SPIIN|nr:unnamed protein product [Spirodela intermedia]